MSITNTQLTLEAREIALENRLETLEARIAVLDFELNRPENQGVRPEPAHPDAPYIVVGLGAGARLYK